MMNQRTNKRQQKLSERDPFFAPAPPIHSYHPPQSEPSSRLDLTSFETAPSPPASSIFTADDNNNRTFISNDTSIMSTPDESEERFLTQGFDEMVHDEDFEKSFNEASFSRPQSRTFETHSTLPDQVPFWCCWEIHRIAALLGHTPLDVFTRIYGTPHQKGPHFGEIWTSLERLCALEGLKSMPTKSAIQDWTTLENRYLDQKSNKAIYFKARLDWNDHPNDDPTPENLFKLQLNEIQLEQSCRLYRRFGADRFLVLSVPEFSSPPKRFRLQGDRETSLRKEIVDFLAGGPHFIAGRYWKVFYVETDKTKKSKREDKAKNLKTEVKSWLKVFMFAETGYDIVPESRPRLCSGHEEVMSEAVAEWHMPVQANMKSTDLKLFSRWGITLSKTTPTITLMQNEFLYLPDPPGPVMNDGCALMSYNLAKTIWEAYGGEGNVPSAVQGRIGGAKGLWLVDYRRRFQNVSKRDFWIQVSESQLKVKPHPRDRSDADESQRTFEVLKYASDCKEGHLNIQLITILEDRGIPRHVLETALISDTESYANSLTAAMEDPKALRLWMQEHNQTAASESQMNFCSFPHYRRDQMKLLLESGFHPKECAKLVECASLVLNDYMASYVEKLWIGLPCSTVVFCAPDPLSVLEEHEVFISFSSAIQDPRTGVSESALEDIDVLVARNPAYLASDMQLRRAVYKHELRHYKNVIIFPTKGIRPLASLLSGGDYDGDTVTVIWDPEFVGYFQNAEPPPMQSERQCGMKQEARPLAEIFNAGKPHQEARQDFLRGCIDFSARPSLMGKCSLEHEKLIYSLSQAEKGSKLSSPGAVLLAALAGYLVDSNKQGWAMTQEDWIRFRREASGVRCLPTPGYKDKNRPPSKTENYPNIIDFLKFVVAENRREKFVTKFKNLTFEAGTYDIVLSEYWKRAEGKAKKDTHRLLGNATEHKSTEGRATKETRKAPSKAYEQQGNSKGIQGLLIGDHGLTAKIFHLKEFAGEKMSLLKEDMQEYRAAVRTIYQQYQAIEPHDIDHELGRRYEDEKDGHLPYWSLLRASCLHYHVCAKRGFPAWVWYVAGRELCVLKAFQHSKIVVMTEEMYNILRVDSKGTKRLLEKKVVVADDEDVTDGVSVDEDDPEDANDGDDFV